MRQEHGKDAAVMASGNGADKLGSEFSTEESAFDKLWRQFKNGLFGTLYISAWFSCLRALRKGGA